MIISENKLWNADMGINLVSYGRITLSLPVSSFVCCNMRMSGSIPKEVGRLKSLRILRMQHNELSGKILDKGK